MKICLFGHPYASIGMSEQLVSFSEAMDEAYIKHSFFDIYGTDARTRADTRRWIHHKEVFEFGEFDVRIFHINGDEIQPVLNHLKEKKFDFSNGYNIIVPAWELANYPEIWQKDINLFDEIWCISKFVQSIFSAEWVKPKVKHVGQAAERKDGLLYPRKSFGIKGSSLVFLSFFDQSSYFTRKNPYSAIEMYLKLRQKHPFGDFQLVLKIKNFNKKSDFVLDLHDENIVLIDNDLEYEEVTSLIDACDVFVSLHRSEGFGRGAAEAILRGKRAIITNYSGVEDYSEDEAVVRVPYQLINLKNGDYPHAEGQVWADPDVDYAVDQASKIIIAHENGSYNTNFYDCTDAGRIAQLTVTKLAVGNNILSNLKNISLPRK